MMKGRYNMKEVVVGVCLVGTVTSISLQSDFSLDAKFDTKDLTRQSSSSAISTRSSGSISDIRLLSLRTPRKVSSWPNLTKKKDIMEIPDCDPTTIFSDKKSYDLYQRWRAENGGPDKAWASRKAVKKFRDKNLNLMYHHEGSPLPLVEFLENCSEESMEITLKVKKMEVSRQLVWHKIWNPRFFNCCSIPQITFCHVTVENGYSGWLSPTAILRRTHLIPPELGSQAAVVDMLRGQKQGITPLMYLALVPTRNEQHAKNRIEASKWFLDDPRMHILATAENGWSIIDWLAVLSRKSDTTFMACWDAVFDRVEMAWSYRNELRMFLIVYLMVLCSKRKEFSCFDKKLRNQILEFVGKDYSKEPQMQVQNIMLCQNTEYFREVQNRMMKTRAYVYEEPENRARRCESIDGVVLDHCVMEFFKLVNPPTTVCFSISCLAHGSTRSRCRFPTVCVTKVGDTKDFCVEVWEVTIIHVAFTLHESHVTSTFTGFGLLKNFLHSFSESVDAHVRL
eukprot:gene174-978_t